MKYFDFNSELKQTRRQRQRKRRSKIKIWEMMTFLIGFFLASSRWQTTLKMDWSERRIIKYREWKIMCLMCVHVVVKPFNLENFKLSCGRLRQRIVLKCVPHVQHDYISSSNQSDHCFVASWLPLQLSLVKLPTVFLRTPEMTSFSHVPYVCTRWGMVRHRWRLSELSVRLLTAWLW